MLPTPVVSEARLHRRNRPRTHHSRSRSRTRYEVKPRPKTTRCYAPIAYTNLSIHYDSGGSSDEGGFSPTRPIAPGSSLFSGYRNYRRMHGSSAVTHDQYALLALKSTKHDHLGDFGCASRAHAYQQVRAATAEKSSKSVTFEQPLNVPPKPYLSIIDLNQLTRGSLERKPGSFDVDHRWQKPQAGGSAPPVCK